MKITSKFSGRCKTCGQAYAAGDQIEWERGQGAAHVTCPTATPVAPVARISVENQGVYVMPDGAIVRVKANREKSRTYASRWIETPDRALEAGGRVRGDFVYERGLVAQVAAEGRKMTLAEAKAFIVKYGHCVRCGRFLKAAESVENGIGPVCIKYFDGWHVDARS